MDKIGNIYAGGQFYNSSGKYYVAKYDGVSWSELGGLNSLAATGKYISLMNQIAIDHSDNVYLAGNLINDSGKYYIAKFDGVSWSELGGINSLKANAEIRTICIDRKGNIYVAGNFTNASGKRYIAKFDGFVWSELNGFNNLKC